MIGSPMDSTGFAELASALAGTYTVVTCDPRGIGNSSRQDAGQDVTPGRPTARAGCWRCSAAHRRPCSAAAAGPSSGSRWSLPTPHQVRALVARESPVVELLPGSAPVRAQIQDIYDTYRAGGADKAMAKFMTHAGLGEASGQQADAPRWEPSPEQIARMRATTDVFLAHLIRPTTRYSPTSPRCGRHPPASWSPPGPPPKDSSPTAAPWHWPAGSARPWSNSR